MPKPVKKPRNVCVFRGALVRERADPKIAKRWLHKRGEPAPFGDLRRIFRREHCSQINPYGSELCPYRESQCVDAFLDDVLMSLARADKNPVGYFRRLTKTSGMKRAEEKPLSRHPQAAILVSHEAPPPGGSGQPGASDQDPQQGPGVSRPKTRFVTVGSVLRALDLGSRQEPAPDGETST